MPTVAVADFVGAIFVAILIVMQYGERAEAKSVKRLRIISFILFVWLMIDGLSYVITGPGYPLPVRFGITLLAYMMGSVALFFFMRYCDAYIRERTEISRWVFYIPEVLSLICAATIAGLFFCRKIIDYDLSTGIAGEVYGIPLYVLVVQILLILYAPVAALSKRKAIGTKAVTLLGLFNLAPLIATAVSPLTKYDYTVFFCAFSLVLIVLLLQRDLTRDRLVKMNAELAESNEELKKQGNIEAQLKHEQLRREILDYMVNHDDDPIELLKQFAERIRVLINCDQVIYRDLEETRIMVNSPAIDKTWSVPIEYCQQCQHFDAHHPMYAGGFTEMNNCQEGWQGIPVYEKCPIKSSLTRIVYCDGKIAGYFAIHYVQEYHHFTDMERATVGEFARILSMSLSRYEAKKENKQLKLISDMQQQLQEALDTEIARARDERAYQLALLNTAYSYFRINISQNRIVPPIIEREHGQPVDYTDRFPEPLPSFEEVMAIGAKNYVDDADKESYKAFHNCAYLTRCFEEGDVAPEYICHIYSNTIGWHYRKYVAYLAKDETSGELLGLLVAYDVTQEYEAREREKTYQSELTEAASAAQSANKAKTDFLFSMSHDIRTPLNAILGFTGMAMRHIDDREKTLDCLEKTQQSGNLLLNLINSVLEVSRIESGHAQLEESVANVDYSFAGIQDTMTEMAESKNISLSFEFGEVRNRFVYCDLDRCNRVFLNIISNAIKYSHEGGNVRVRCDQIESEREGYGNYRYTFEDDGIGMSEEFQKHVYEYFSREETSTVSGIQGSGLGMAVCKSFVDLMGGTIECKSRPGRGTVFTVVLPFRIQEGEHYLDPLTREEVDVFGRAVPDKRVDLEGRRVLLVEDNELNSEIAEELLQDEGMFVETAPDGSEAVRLMKEKGPEYYDFILMDIQMPVMDGYEATREIRAMYPDDDIPIIALSANAFAEDRAASRAAGMNAHVAKPINKKVLFDALAACLRK